MASERAGWLSLRAGGGHGRLLLVGLGVLAVALGSCVGVEAHPADAGALAKRLIEKEVVDRAALAQLIAEAESRDA